MLKCALVKLLLDGRTVHGQRPFGSSGDVRIGRIMLIGKMLAFRLQGRRFFAMTLLLRTVKLCYSAAAFVALV